MRVSFKSMTPLVLAGLLSTGVLAVGCSPETEEEIQTPQGETEIESEPGEIEEEVDTPQGEAETEVETDD